MSSSVNPTPTYNMMTDPLWAYKLLHSSTGIELHNSSPYQTYAPDSNNLRPYNDYPYRGANGLATNVFWAISYQPTSTWLNSDDGSKSKAYITRVEFEETSKHLTYLSKKVKDITPENINQKKTMSANNPSISQSLTTNESNQESSLVFSQISKPTQTINIQETIVKMHSYPTGDKTSSFPSLEPTPTQTQDNLKWDQTITSKVDQNEIEDELKWEQRTVSKFSQSKNPTSWKSKLESKFNSISPTTPYTQAPIPSQSTSTNIRSSSLLYWKSKLDNYFEKGPTLSVSFQSTTFSSLTSETSIFVENHTSLTPETKKDETSVETNSSSTTIKSAIQFFSNSSPKTKHSTLTITSTHFITPESTSTLTLTSNATLDPSSLSASKTTSTLNVVSEEFTPTETGLTVSTSVETDSSSSQTIQDNANFDGVEINPYFSKFGDF